MIMQLCLKGFTMCSLAVVIFFTAAAQQLPQQASAGSATTGSMVDPAIDDPAKPWCYLQKSTTLVGVPYMPDAVQVTFDGALYTGNAELCFYYGKPLRPVLARQKSWYDGWIPIVQYGWQDDGFTYKTEMFGSVLEGEDAANTLQFVRIEITNNSDHAATPALAAATRSTGIDYRFGGGDFFPQWIFEIGSHSVIRNGKLVFSFSKTGYPEAVHGEKYKGPFKGADLDVKKNTAVCLIRYKPLLQPGESAAYVFKMPRLPVDTADKSLIHKIETADYNRYRTKTIRFWKSRVLNGRATFDIPEKRVNDALKASLVHMLQATRQRDGRRFMTDGLPYPDLFLTSFVQHQAAFDYFGFREAVDQSLPYVYAKQDTSGLFYDGALLHGKKLGVAQGQTLHMLCEHFLLTGDRPYIDTAYPKIKAAVQWLINAIRQEPSHLMPPAWPYDNEMILGHYTSNNLWAILGLRSAIQIARRLGKEQDAAAWTDSEKFYRASLLKAVKSTFKEKGYVTPGLYRYITGEAARKGFKEWQTNQEWENMLLASPSELLAPDDPIVDATLDRIRRERYRGGIMTYRIYLHQYITINMMDQELAKGDAKEALTDLYNVLLHLGSTYEGFENLVKPWEDRRVDPACPTPHAWASSKLVCFIRDMLVREYGGMAGMNEGARSLYLFSLISPDWCRNGQEVAVHNARTEMGTLSASMRFTDSGAIVKVDPAFDMQPDKIVITIPYFVQLTGFTSDASKAERQGRRLFFSPDMRRVKLSWKREPGTGRGTFTELLKRYRSESTLQIADGKEVIIPHSAYLLPGEKNHAPAPLSFDLVRRAFVHEYALRFHAFRAAGGAIDTVKAPGFGR